MRSCAIEDARQFCLHCVIGLAGFISKTLREYEHGYFS
jgi:hypothetical protein